MSRKPRKNYSPKEKVTILRKLLIDQGSKSKHRSGSVFSHRTLDLGPWTLDFIWILGFMRMMQAVRSHRARILNELSSSSSA
jgi:hypothetical protein